MDKSKRFVFQWLGRCKYGTSDKVWGWFFYRQAESDKIPQPKCYVVWGRTGKTPSFKTHPYDKWEMKRMEANKLDKKYESISSDELKQIWPTVYDDLENRFVLHLLRDSF